MKELKANEKPRPVKNVEKKIDYEVLWASAKAGSAYIPRKLPTKN